jgi:hypothetical protein
VAAAIEQESMMGDLPLFSWTPPSADVVPFPAGRRVAYIRHRAERFVEVDQRRRRAVPVITSIR